MTTLSTFFRPFNDKNYSCVPNRYSFKKKPRRHGDAENHAAKMTGWMDPGRSEGVREEGGFR